MRGRTLLWFVTVFNVAIAVTLISSIWALLYAIRAFAAYIRAWPLSILILLGFIFSIVGMRLANTTDHSLSRRIGFMVHGSTLTLHSIVLVILAALFLGIRHERFIIPDGYMGDIYVLHSVPDGEPEDQVFGRTTYRIPKDGVLRTQTPIVHGLARTAYYYLRDDGGLEPIPHQWYSTIPKTPENLKNAKDIGIFFPRTGSYRTTGQPCSVQFVRFFVGTSAYLFSNYQQIDLAKYLKDHPISCGSPAY